MTKLAIPLPHAPLPDLGVLLNQQHRLPRLGDAVAPWHFRGWLLPYVIQLHDLLPSVARRWSYHLRTLEAGHLLDEPIPQISFTATPNGKILSMLHEWASLINFDCGGWSDFRSLLDWLSWGLALIGEEPRLSEQVNEKLYRKVDVGPLLQQPYDYLGDFVAQGMAKGWNPNAFFPTPHAVVKLMVRMVMHDKLADGRDPRLRTVLDPCVGSGRFLLHASNFSFNLYGQDIDPLAVAMCKINGALYVPWMSFPLPASILKTQAPLSIPSDRPVHYVNDRGERLLFAI
jgi:hypothetical protein